MIDWFERLNGWIWGIPALGLILGVGIYLSLTTGFVQLRLLPDAIGHFLDQFRNRGKKGDNSPYRALCTALAATVGTGNLAGVAGAIAVGGPGAIFWMWICGILGMATKFSEAVLSVRYRIKNGTGEWVGGPMYMIRDGLGKKWRILAAIYAFFGVVAALGVGNATQINAVVGGIDSVIRMLGGELDLRGTLVIGLLLALVVTMTLAGGARCIGLAAEKIVPIAAAFYILLGMTALGSRISAIPAAFSVILKGAFYPRAVTGGLIGSAAIVLRVGASRGVFTNEAGMGTAAIAHAGADVKNPVEQGMMGIMEVLIDTLVICTITALVILTSGVPVPYGKDVGVRLTVDAFCAVFGNWVTIPIAISLCSFAIATVFGWSLYGVRCAQYLFGDGVLHHFAFFQGVMVIVGAVVGTGTVWIFAEMVNGLMAIPNLIALLMLSPELIRLVKRYAPIRKDRCIEES